MDNPSYSVKSIALLGTTANCVLGFRASLIEKLVSCGCTVYAFAIDYDEISRGRVRDLGAIPIDYKLNRSGLNPFLDLWHTFNLARKLKILKLDLIFSYFSKPVIFGTFAAIIAGVPRRVGMLEGLGYAFTEHRNGLLFKSNILKNIQIFLYRLSIPFLEALIFLNPDDPIDLIKKNGIDARSVFVLGGIGVDLEKYPYAKVDTQAISFLFIGRLLIEKGIDQFLEAAKIVKRTYPFAQFVVLGGLDEGNPGSLSQVMLDKLIAEKLITYPGHVSDVRPWIINSSVFVLPSYREGVPLSTQEAMAIGRAIITTDVPGCRETVVNGVNGFLVPPWSSQALADKMIYLIENPHKILEMGEQSARIAREKYDANIVNTRLLDMLGISKKG